MKCSEVYWICEGLHASSGVYGVCLELQMGVGYELWLYSVKLGEGGGSLRVCVWVA